MQDLPVAEPVQAVPVGAVGAQAHAVPEPATVHDPGDGARGAAGAAPARRRTSASAAIRARLIRAEDTPPPGST